MFDLIDIHHLRSHHGWPALLFYDRIDIITCDTMLDLIGIVTNNAMVELIDITYDSMVILMVSGYKAECAFIVFSFIFSKKVRGGEGGKGEGKGNKGSR